MAFGLSMYFCTNSVYSLYMKHVENPVILSLSHKTASIGEIPFPGWKKYNF